MLRVQQDGLRQRARQGGPHHQLGERTAGEDGRPGRGKVREREALQLYGGGAQRAEGRAEAGVRELNLDPAVLSEHSQDRLSGKRRGICRAKGENKVFVCVCEDFFAVVDMVSIMILYTPQNRGFQALIKAVFILKCFQFQQLFLQITM